MIYLIFSVIYMLFVVYFWVLIYPTGDTKLFKIFVPLFWLPALLYLFFLMFIEKK